MAGESVVSQERTPKHYRLSRSNSFHVPSNEVLDQLFLDGGVRSRLIERLHHAFGLIMDRDLENVIRQAIADAQAAGRDYLAQTELAVRAVRQVRPDMTASDALTAVNIVRRS